MSDRLAIYVCMLENNLLRLMALLFFQLLFLMFINYISHSILDKPVKMRLLANDSILYQKVTDPADQDRLISCLAEIYNWCELRQMTVNSIKYVCVNCLK